MREEHLRRSLYNIHKSTDVKVEFIPLSDDEIVEERLLIEHLEGITSTFVSDHILNLLQEVEGKLPGEEEKMLKLINSYRALPKKR